MSPSLAGISESLETLSAAVGVGIRKNQFQSDLDFLEAQEIAADTAVDLVDCGFMRIIHCLACLAYRFGSLRGRFGGNDGLCCNHAAVF